MNDRATRDKLLAFASDYVDAHLQEFDPADAGVFWGDALCHVLGGADYLEFPQVMAGGAVISVMPVFGELVHPEQFTAGQLSTVISAAGEIQDATANQPDGLDVGTEPWILSVLAQTLAPPSSPDFVHLGTPPALTEALFVTSFWLLNAPGGLVDLTGIRRPW